MWVNLFNVGQIIENIQWATQGKEKMQSHDGVVKYAPASLCVDAFPLNVFVTVIAEGCFSKWAQKCKLKVSIQFSLNLTLKAECLSSKKSWLLDSVSPLEWSLHDFVPSLFNDLPCLHTLSLNIRVSYCGLHVRNDFKLLYIDFFKAWYRLWNVFVWNLLCVVLW